MKKTIITCMLSMLCIYAAAQRHEHFTGCGHDHLHSSKMDSDASYRAKHEAFEKLIQGYLEDMPEGNAKAAPPIYTLPVVFHVIHNNGPENISNAQAQQALQDLNNAFENIGYYDPTTGVDVQIAFCLARQAPNGGPTTGINRIVSPLTNFNMDINDLTVKNLSRWDPLRYINIWIVNEITSFQGSGVVGYAYLPSAHGQIYDGIVMEAGYTGNSPANSAVLVHEMGHYLGLYHTFQGGCTNNNCLVDGDRVCDTPPDANTAYITCGSSMNTCNTDDDDLRPVNPFRPLAQGGLGDQPDMHINYMDYSLLNCYSAFTQGQKDRMQLVVAGIRNSLLASSGCTSPCPAPINPAFTIAPNPASVGQSVNFTNTGGTSASYRWNINNVPFATTRNAANTFASVGTYRVSLVVDPGGVCQDSFVRDVTVSCSTSASFSASNLTPAAGTETVQFTNGSTGATSQQWLVNNVQVSTAQNLSRVFVSAGSYQVCLVASSATCSNTFCLGINALSPSSAENCSDGIDNDGDGRIDRLDADCVIAPSCNLNTGGLLSIATAWEGTTADLSPVLDPIVGDLDGDGIPEIIAGICGFSNAYGASSAANSSPGYRIYRGDGSNRTSTAVDVRIRLYTFDRLPMSNCAIADIDGNGTVEIVAVDRDGFVFVFPSSGGDATIPSTYLRKSTQPSSFYFGSVKIADINQDGTPEIIVGTDVFVWDTNTLEKRVSGSLSLPYGKNVFFPSWVTDVAIVDILQPQDCTNGNCAGLEIVAGSKVYSPDLINGTLNIVRDLSTIDNTVASNEDGPTAVADMNLDGNMDIVFAGENHLFIWSPRNSSVLLKNQNWVVRGYNRQQRGRPTIANYYNDTQNGYSINLPEVLVCTTSKLTSFNLNYPNGVQWNRNIPTLIGQISATAYDLNADGASELIYRDEFNMRIVNGNTTTPTDYATIQSYSLPVLESPTLADVDGDGQTNIVCAASDLLCNTNDPRSYPSRLRVYKSGTSGFWAPSRKIWNQRGCHPTAISDDLRVPRVEQSRTIQVPAGQTPLSYGLNTYNVQTTDNFLPPSYVSAPDLTGVITSFNCSTRSISFGVSNLNGSTLAPTGISVTFYDGNPTTTNAPILGRFVTTQTIAAGATLNNLTATSSITPTSGTIYMVVNDGGSLARPFNLATQFPVTNILECSYVNNIHSIQVRCSENCTDGIDNDGDGQIDLLDADCVITPTCRINNGSSFGITPSWESAANDLSSFCTPIVGDIDNDGMPEIIVPVTLPGGGTSPGYRIYNGDGSNRTSTAVDVRLPILTFQTVPLSNVAIANFDGVGTSEIIAVGEDGFVYIFSHLGGNAVIGNYLRISNQPTSYTSASPRIADLDQDGTPEIIVGIDVFRLEAGNTLRKVITGPSGFPDGQEGNRWGADIVVADMLSPADCGSGLCGGLEIVAGSKVYSPNMTNGTLNVVRDLSVISTQCPLDEDGPTAVADMNLDGNLDVVFSGPNDVYIWSPRTNSLLRKVTGWTQLGYGATQRGMPTISNFYDDRQNGYAVNLPEATICTSRKLTSFNLNFPSGVQWNLATTDNSGATGLSSYDLNGDGIDELIYRDEQNLRIINGNVSPPTNYISLVSNSPTASEHTTVADVDNDGETNLVIVATDVLFRDTDLTTFNPGRLKVYRGATANRWTPSRNLWNQRGYTPVSVLPNLQIPRVEQNRLIEIPRGQTPPMYGLNKYNVQTTDNFLPPSYVSAPDLTGVITSFNCSTRSINFNISNLNGSTLAPTGISVTFYDGNPTATNAPILGRFVTTQTIAAGATLNNLTATSSITPTSGSIYMVVNDGGILARPFNLATQFPVTNILECSYVNNIHSIQVRCSENCTDGIDNDGDGLIDCYDPNCCGNAACQDVYYSPCLSSTCTFSPSSSTFGMNVQWQTNLGDFAAFTEPVVGDLDLDGNNEVVARRYNASSNGIVIMDGLTGAIEAQFGSTQPDNFFGCLAIADIDKNDNGFAEIIYGHGDGTIQCFNHDGTLVWTSPQIIFSSSYYTSPPMPSIADFNGDGFPEIYAGPFILNGQTGALMGTGNAGSGSLPSGGLRPVGVSVAVDAVPTAQCPACDGLELVAGNTVYAVTINRLANTATLTPITTAAGESDGLTSVADWNADGQLDGIISTIDGQSRARVYVYNLRTGTSIGAFVINGFSNNVIGNTAIANLDSDSALEACFATYNKLITIDNNFTQKWSKNTVDISGATGCTVFDFNNDGSAEVCFRDETTFFVLNGNNGAVLNSIPSQSGTSYEYPVIVDVDKDNETEILVINGGVRGVNEGNLVVYKSSQQPWLPSRSVWNQHVYHYTNINDDLSVPTNMQQHQLPGNRTLNSFLSQYGRLDFPAVDLSVLATTATCVSSNSASVTYVVTNTGIPTGGGMSVSFYNGNPNTAGSTRILTVNNLPALATGASVTLTQALTGLAAGNVVYILVNDNGSDPVPVTFPITGIPECNYTNNTASVTLTPCNTCTFDAALSAVTVTCDRDSLILTTQICNTGTGPIPANFGISCWLGNPVTLASAARLGFQQTNTALAPNTCRPITFRIPRQLGNFTIVANDVIGSTPLLNLSNPPIPECDMTDNVVTGIFAGYPPPTLELGPNINACENGIANINAQAGFATYRWQDGFDGRQYTATRSGIYALTVTDICGFTQADTVTVSFSNPIVLNLPDTIRVCQGTSRIISAPVGVPSYTYSWFPNIELAGVTAANATITPTTNRTYQLIVTNVNGCLAVDSIHIEVQNCLEICNDGIDNNANGLIDCLDPFCAVALSLNDRDSACIGSSIQLNPITTASAIAWTGLNGFISTLRAPILSNIQLIDGGIYRITVTDSNGCSTSDTIDIEVLGTPIITATGGTFCEQSLASVSATGAISYSWTSSNNWFGSGQTVLLGPANNALAGVYSVTGTDINGCTASTSTTLQVTPAPSISVSITTNISCFGVCDGLIALTPNSNNTGYVWSNGGSGVVQSGLCAGAYSVTVSNSIGCTASLSNIVLNQPLQITASITVVRPISCHGRCDAELMVAPSGGSGSYRILWDDGQFANTSTGRCFGPYSVTITDTNNCSTVITGNLPTPLPLNAVIQSDDARCHGEPSGVAEAQVIGGTLPYSFLWNNAQVRAVATGLAAGNYSVTISDANGCSLSMGTTIQEPTSLSASITGSFLDCFDGTDGTVQLNNVSGGIPPYYAQWDDGTVGFIVTNRPIGSLGVVLSDANGCSLRLVGTVSAPTPLRIFADSLRMPTCHGYSDGFASVNPQGGVWPYRYRWGNGSTFAQIQLVPAGVYEVTVTDANGCTAQNTNILINQPSPVSLILTPIPAILLCHGAENGSITPRITGGTMPYSYYWDDGARQSDRSGLPANRYTLLVKDANECAVTDSVNITAPVPLNASVVVEQPLCFGDLGGFEIVVDATTGRAPFRYAVNDALFGNNALYQGMEEGTYRIRVKDANDCNFTDTIFIEEPLEIQLQLPDTFYVSSPNRARLSNTIINAIGQLSYRWTPSTGLDCNTCAEPISSASGTAAYTLRVTDSNGCVAEANTIVLSEDKPCLFVPNSFTPNDDGANDYFYPKSGECVSQIISLKIFDRWGELVFEQKNFEPNVPNLGWNGMFNGEPMDNGVYVWSMEVLFQNGKREIVNGDVTLLK